MTVSGHAPYASMTKAELVEEVIRLNKENTILRKRLAIYKEMR